ncbi:MAG TPA: hypothetical protein VJ781_12185, partial [Pyrinomonadaceae bacterium]|nr:hypothetical protein [Pyrinomonadaceae bacterium]
KMNTVLEQLPKPGETVKTGQLILVVVSKAGQVADETPKSLQEDIEADDTKKIEEMISDKPKRTRSSSNSNANSAKKTADTTRDTIANTPLTTVTDAAKGDLSAENSNKKDPGAGTSDKSKSNSSTGPTMKPQASPKPPASRP